MNKKVRRVRLTPKTNGTEVANDEFGKDFPVFAGGGGDLCRNGIFGACAGGSERERIPRAATHRSRRTPGGRFDPGITGLLRPGPPDRRLLLRGVLVVAAGRSVVPGEGVQRAVGCDRAETRAPGGGLHAAGLQDKVRTGAACPVRPLEEGTRPLGPGEPEGAQAMGEGQGEGVEGARKGAETGLPARWPR